jgi:hypothetical protein
VSGGARRDDLDQVIDGHGVLLTGNREGEQLDAILGCRLDRFFDEPFATLAGGLFESLQFG